MKILILVTSCKEPPYPKLLNGQQNTWDLAAHNDCETLFYQGNPDRPGLNGNTLDLDCSDGYYDMHWKFKKVLDCVWDWEWDYLFKTNSSTYVNKNKLYEYLQNHDLTYAGSLYPGRYHSERTLGRLASMIDLDYVTGTNIVLNRKAVKVLMENIKEHPYEKPIEDIVIGQVLLEAGIKAEDGIPVSRWEWDLDQVGDPNFTLVRCRSNNNDRNKDIDVFNKLFRKYTLE